MNPSIASPHIQRISPRRSHETGPDTAPRIRLRIEHQSSPGAPQHRSFTRKGLTLGRDAANTLRLANTHALVSRHHAEICFLAGVFWVSDLGSKNATWLNGQRLEAGRHYSLRTGDCLTVGDYRLEVMLDQANAYAVAGGWP